ncbi:MAG TPA: protein kinase [Gemmatimonadaceae bacterium]|nr:protein kinase [Gemmatimonadaceae bacterium]
MANELEDLRTALSERYRIEREVGRGGMATVYVAEDLKHHRQVAIKVLDPDLAAGLGHTRFLREIEIASRLSHPHILPLFDSGESGGFLYYVMPFVEGESLRSRIQREKQLSIPDTVAIGRSVAGALSYAHGQGIVHRDIKPENILFAAGQPVVTDFGIARAVGVAGGDQLTQTGIAIGTPAYMSPEQAAGDRELDARSDVYALGCVLYEMLAGQPPFTGRTAQALLARHAIDPVPPLRTIRHTIPAALEAVVLRALAKTPADRFRTAGELAEALEQGEKTVETAAPVRARRRRSISVLAAAVLGILGFGGWWLAPRLGVGSARIESLAVLPLTNLGGDSRQDYFVEGMQEALIAELSKISALKVISRTSTLRYRKTEKPLSDVANELNVDGVIEGSALREGDQVRITVKLVDGRSDRHVWGQTFDRELRGVLALHSEVAREIANQIKVSLTPPEAQRLAVRRAVNPKAYELYVLGRHQWNQRTLERNRQAVESFLEALDHDPSYAPTYAALADAYMWLGEQGGMPQREARDAAAGALAKALALDETLADAHVSMGLWKLRSDWDWAASERELRRAIELNPSSASAHQMYGRTLSFTGRFEDALRELEKARELDPLSVPVNAYIGQVYLHARRYGQAEEQLRKTLRIDPNHVLTHHNLGELHLAQGRSAEAVKELERSIAGSAEPSSHYLAMLGCSYARAGRKAEAVKILKDLEAKATKDLASAFDVASLYAALSDKEQALGWLEQGYAKRDYWLVEIHAWPWFDSLRSEPRFQDLLRRMRFPA